MNTTTDQVGAQLYVWLQQYGDKIHDHMPGMLDIVRAAEYAGVEGWLSWFDLPDKAERIAALLEERGLKILALYHDGVVHDADQAAGNIDRMLRLAETAKSYGCNILNFNPTPISWQEPLNKTDKQLQVQAESLNEIGRGLREMGMTLLVHNHNAEMRENAKEHRANLELTDAELVFFCLDPDWIQKGGQDAIRLVEEAAPRLKSLHLRNAKAGVWLEALGEGDVDYQQVKAILDRMDYDGLLIVELAYSKDTVQTRSIPDNLRLSRAYVREVFGV
jgi:inosose dehydratase